MRVALKVGLVVVVTLTCLVGLLVQAPERADAVGFCPMQTGAPSMGDLYLGKCYVNGCGDQCDLWQSAGTQFYDEASCTNQQPWCL